MNVFTNDSTTVNTEDGFLAVQVRGLTEAEAVQVFEAARDAYNAIKGGSIN